MATTTYRTTVAGDVIEISANFAEASCPVEGTNGRQVADFRHRPVLAMDYAVRRYYRECGEDVDSEEISGAIDDAVEAMIEVSDEEE